MQLSEGSPDPEHLLFLRYCAWHQRGWSRIGLSPYPGEAYMSDMSWTLTEGESESNRGAQGEVTIYRGKAVPFRSYGTPTAKNPSPSPTHCRNFGKPLSLYRAKLSWAKWRGLYVLLKDSHKRQLKNHHSQQDMSTQVWILTVRNKDKITHRWFPHTSKTLSGSINPVLLYKPYVYVLLISASNQKAKKTWNKWIIKIFATNNFHKHKMQEIKEKVKIP